MCFGEGEDFDLDGVRESLNDFLDEAACGAMIHEWPKGHGMPWVGEIWCQLKGI